MKKFGLIIGLAIIGTMTFTGVASAQCKVENTFDKYKIDSRCNSVIMSKEMLKVIASQHPQSRIADDLKDISSVKILSVKIPRERKYTTAFVYSNGNMGHNRVKVTNGDVTSDGGATSIATVSSGASSANDSSQAYTITTNGTSEGEELASSGVRNGKYGRGRVQIEKQAQRTADQKLKIEEITALTKQIAKEVDSCIETSKYTELMSVNEDGKMVKYFSKQVDDKIKEFIVVSNSSKEYSLIVIKGDDIKIESVSRLGNIIPSARIDVDDYIN